MLKKTFVATCAVSALFALAPLNQAIAAELNKPNFVTIMIDDMGFSDLGAFGGEIDTPQLDQLATGGTIMTNFYSAPTSTPARAMFFTGKTNHKAGVGNMAGFIATRPSQQGQPGYVGELLEEVQIFPDALDKSGYRTMMTGKWDLGEDDPKKYPFNRGFDDTLVLLPGGDVHFLSDAEGKLITSQPPSYYEKLGRSSPYNKNGQEFSDFPPNAFSTDFYTDSAIEMLNNWAQSGSSEPFYLNIAHIASHGPFQATEELIQKYLPIYSKGWDAIRAERFERLKTLGYLQNDLTLPPLPPEAQPWDSLTPEQQAVEARRMATYAGMVEMLDNSVGKLVDHLKSMNQYENTVFFVFSDNGGAAIEAGSPAKVKHVNANFTKDDSENLDNMGSASSFIPASPGWGTVSNMPFNRYKNSTFDGGMHTASFVHYPQSKSNGQKYKCVASIMDVAPTILEMAEAQASFTDPVAMDGVSFKKLFDGDLSCDNQRYIAFEQDSIKMVRQGDWKLAQKWDYSRQRWDSNVYMFNLKDDPLERHDLRFANPEKYQALLSLYDTYAQENQVIDVGARIFGAKGQGAIVNGQPSEEAFIIGGSQVNYKSMLHPAESTAKAGDIVDVAGEIHPPQAHVGQAGEVMAVALYIPPAGAPSWLTFGGGDRADSAFSVTPWDGNPSNIPVYRSYPSGLPARIDVPIYEGLLFSGISGQFHFLIGYRTAEGSLVYNETPFSLIVE